MSSSFDPYHKWLGIPPKDQPPHHYRLLGIELFEPDVEVIESAANRLMAYLHDVATGDPTGLSQQLLNEIAAARICLVTPERKAAYDAQLRSAIASQQAAIASARQSDTPAVTGEPRTRLPRYALVAFLAVTGAGLLALLVIAGSGWLGDNSLSQSAPRQTSTQPAEQTLLTDTNTMLWLDWPETQRVGASLHVNGVPQDLPAQGPIELPLPAGPFELRMTRAGYVEVLCSGVAARGEQVQFSPAWEPLEQSDSAADPDSTTRDATEPRQEMEANAPTQRKLTADATARMADPSASTVPPDRWAELPAQLPLPSMSASVEAHTPTASLLILPATARLQLRLVGGESIAGTESFQLTEQQVPAHQQWRVHLIDSQQHRTEIGQFTFRDQTLGFQWQPDHGASSADLLRNAVLEISDLQHRCQCALRAATSVEPLPISGARRTGPVTVRIDALPEVDSLRLEVIESTGAASFRNTFSDRSTGPDQPLRVDLGAADLEFPLAVTLSFRVLRRTAGVVRLEYEVRYRSHFAPLIELTPLNVDRDVRQTRRLIQQRTEPADRDQLAATLDYFTQLEAIATGKSELRLHYRIVLPVGTTNVVLAESPHDWTE